MAPQSGVAGWGGQVFDSGWSADPYVEVAAGFNHTVVRRPDGFLPSDGLESVACP